MLNAGNHDFPAACADLLTAHRIARLIGQGPTLFDCEVATTIEQVVIDADLALIRAPGISSQDLHHYAELLAALPPLSPIAKALDNFERFSHLDMLISCATRGQQVTSRLCWGDLDPPFSYTSLKAINILPVHYDAALQHINALFDEAVAAELLPTYSQRKSARSALEPSERNDGFLPGLWFQLLPLDKKILAANPPFEDYACPDRREEAIMRLDLTRLAYALAAYHADHAIYPTTLTALIPTYTTTIPLDRFTNSTLVYASSPTTYLLYSRGIKMIDNHGSPTTESTTPNDDLPVSSSPPLVPFRTARDFILRTRNFY